MTSTPAGPPLDVPEIVAGAYQLRPLEPADAADLLEMLADPSISGTMSGPPPSSLDDMADWIERRLDRARNRTGLTWTVRTAVGGVLAGTVECHHLDEDESTGEIGYSTATAHRRQGVASSAVRGVTGYLHSALSLHRLEILHEPENLASCRVANACGYRAEGTLRGAGFIRETYVDLHLHAHLATDPGG